MKKVILSAVALMIGGFVFAQTTPVAPTAPTNAQALTPMAPAPATANMGHSIQNGNSNKVAVLQVGESQGAYTVQDDGTGTGDNRGRILQTGNAGPTSGDANMAELHQRGSVNESTQIQLGNMNQSLVNQGLANTASSGNRAEAQQGDNAAQQAENNKIQINQDGTLNQARTQQRFDKNEAFTDQDGDSQYADIHQNASPNNSDGHAAHVDQDGTSNDAWVRQDGDGARNEASSLQNGTANYSWQEQFSTASAGGLGNNALVAQGTNAGNAMTVAIDTDMKSNVDDYAAVGGGVNGSSILNTAVQLQNGDNNTVATFQRGGLNYSEQNQDGDGNQALTIQSFYDPAATGLNYARQDQTGDNNLSGIGQGGIGNRALQRQIGNGNKALSVQTGTVNNVNIHQRGNLSSATTGQRGINNDALVVQYDGQSYSVEQNLDGLSGGNNSANIYQAGPNGGGGAIPMGFDAPEARTSRVNIASFTLPDICSGC